MELKIAQEISSIDQSPLLLVFLDVRKAYDTVDQELLIITMGGVWSRFYHVWTLGCLLGPTAISAKK